jgi:DNA-binding MarR family transcriptional regulator
LEDEREAIIEHIVTADKRFDRDLHAGWGRHWADVDLTMPQLKVLMVVANGRGVTMTHLARGLGMTLSTLTGVVDRLTNQCLVRREYAVHDRRSVLLYPTEKGSETFERLYQAGRENMRAILERLSLDDLRRVAQALDTLCEVASRLQVDAEASTS